MRGNNVSAKIQTNMLSPQSYDTRLNDLFLHALFARLAFKNNETLEFSTKYYSSINTVELEIPDRHLDVFNQVIGIQRGPNLIKFINWLIGSNQLSGGGDGDVSSKFLSTSDINLWFGANYFDLGGSALCVLLPSSIASAINANFRTSANFSGDISLRLNWVFINGTNSDFKVKVNVTCIDSAGDSYVVSKETTISTFNLIANDIRSTSVIDLPDIGSDTLLDIVIMRNYSGSSDSQSETIGVLGIELVM